MFFLRLYKKTNLEKHTEFKYQLRFWNKTYGVGDLQETHRLDYVAESWVITQFSSVSRHLVYDTATLFSFYQYLNKHGIVLQIKAMSRDFEMFPHMERGSYFSEFARIERLQKFEIARINAAGGLRARSLNLNLAFPITGSTGFVYSNLFLRTNLRFKAVKFPARKPTKTITVYREKSLKSNLRFFADRKNSRIIAKRPEPNLRIKASKSPARKKLGRLL